MTPILWLLLAAAAVGATGFWYSWKRRRPKPWLAIQLLELILLTGTYQVRDNS